MNVYIEYMADRNEGMMVEPFELFQQEKPSFYVVNCLTTELPVNLSVT